MNSKYPLNLFPVFLSCDHFNSRCGDIVGESFLTSADSPTFMIVTMDTKFAGSRVTNKGFKLHFELEREGNTLQILVYVTYENKPDNYLSCKI